MCEGTSDSAYKEWAIGLPNGQTLVVRCKNRPLKVGEPFYEYSSETGSFLNYHEEYLGGRFGRSIGALFPAEEISFHIED